MTSTEQLNCFYLDSSLKPASDMLRKCVQDESSPYMFDCGTDPMRQENTGDVKNTARMNDISIQRGITEFHVSGFDGDNVVMRPKVSENSAPKLNPLIDINLTEGFHNGSNVAHQARDQQFNAQMFNVNVNTKSFNGGRRLQADNAHEIQWDTSASAVAALTDQVPACTPARKGYFLAATIDEKDTMLFCAHNSGKMAWEGFSGLGGFFGQSLSAL